MSLREEIKKITPGFEADNGVHYRVRDKLCDESANEYINKVLDAVLTDAKFMAYDDGELYLGDLISILDKLRDES